MAKIKTSPKLKSQVPTGALKDKWDQTSSISNFRFPGTIHIDL